MTITREVINTQHTYAEDISVYRPTFSSWELVDTKDDAGNKEATYQLMEGDPEYPAVIRLGVYNNEKSQRTNLSAKLSTFLKKVDDDDETTYEEFVVTVAVSGPYGQVLTGTYASVAIQNLILFSGLGMQPRATATLQASPISGDNTVRSRLSFGIPTFEPGDMDDPAES